MTEADARFMRRAIALAAPGVGRTGSNPSVGCIVVQGDAIVGQGATGEGGRPHAEELALDQAGEAARGAVAYVTLEPCAQRSTGGISCSERLIAAGVAKVVIACADASPFASGHGARRLQAASVAVETGMLEAEAAAALYADYRPGG